MGEYKRITRRDENGAVIVNCGLCSRKADCTDRGNCIEVDNRLAAYEDSGLSPERVAELGTADAAGRVIVLPCKVGTEVFYITTTCAGCPYELDDLCQVQTDDYKKIDLVCGKPHIASAPYRVGMKADIFLTQSESETALERMKTDDR